MKKELLLFFIFNLSLIIAGFAQQSCPQNTPAYNYPVTITDTSINQLNCHQYVRTALLNNGVNMVTGYHQGPMSNLATYNGSSNSIAYDTETFVKVCNKDYAQAICFSDYGVDHSALVLSGGIYTGGSGDFSSTAGHNSPVARHGQASMNAGPYATQFYYYAVLPTIIGTSSLSDGSSANYQIQNKEYIQGVTWSVSNSSLEIVPGTGTGNSTSVKAICTNGSGTYEVKAHITIKGSGEVVTIKKAVIVTCNTDCFNNTIDNKNLNTFNYVSSNTNHKIKMGESRTWNKSWGNTNYWYSTNGGKEMNFSVPYGCVSFTAYNGSCGTQTFTFCASSSYSLKSGTKATSVSSISKNEPTPFHVYDFSGTLVRTGFLEDYGGGSPLTLLPDGLYILKIYDTSEKVYIKN